MNCGHGSSPCLLPKVLSQYLHAEHEEHHRKTSTGMANNITDSDLLTF